MNLNALKPQIESYIKFAKQFPSVYRAPIVTYLLSHDRSRRDPSVGNGTAAAATRGESDVSVASDTNPADLTAPVEIIALDDEESLDPDVVLHSLAAEVGVPAKTVGRLLALDRRGLVTVKAIIEEDTIAKKQIAYSLLYLLALEKTGREAARSSELRELCESKYCYNSPNFTRNYKASPYINRYGQPRSQDHEWMLTQNGRAEARRLLHQLAEGPPHASQAAFENQK
jgi:hypothetical protein